MNFASNQIVKKIISKKEAQNILEKHILVDIKSEDLKIKLYFFLKSINSQKLQRNPMLRQIKRKIDCWTKNICKCMAHCIVI